MKQRYWITYSIGLPHGAGTLYFVDLVLRAHPRGTVTVVDLELGVDITDTRRVAIELLYGGCR